jgi:hypothetical protein
MVSTWRFSWEHLQRILERSAFTQTVQDLIKQRFPKLTFASNNSITSRIESQQSRITEMNDRSYLKKFLKLINERPKLEKYDSTKRVYILVIELLLHDAYISLIKRNLKNSLKLIF